MSSLRHLSSEALDLSLDSLMVNDRGTTADIVAHIAEIDRRGSYAPAYTSMHGYCLGRLHMSEDAAYKRIQAARTAREFPLLFEELAVGRLNLSSVCLIAPHLTSENLDAMVAMATHRSNAEIRQWLMERAAGSRPVVAALKPQAPARQLEVRLPRLAVQQVEQSAVVPLPEPLAQEPAAGPVAYDMQFTMTPQDHERLRYAQALLSHAVPSGDVAEIYRRAIELLIQECERRKFAATPHPKEKGSSVRGRCIPALVRRAVWTRDHGRCTFVAPSGQRCGSRAFLEFDHVLPVARGGLATEENLRLRCRGHNQVAAKRVFGSKFMRDKRREAHGRREIAREFRIESAISADSDAVWVGTVNPP